MGRDQWSPLESEGEREREREREGERWIARSGEIVMYIQWSPLTSPRLDRGRGVIKYV